MRLQDWHVVDPEFRRSDIMVVDGLEWSRSNRPFDHDRHERPFLAAIAGHRRRIASHLAFVPARRTLPGAPDIVTLLVSGAFHDLSFVVVRPVPCANLSIVANYF